MVTSNGVAESRKGPYWPGLVEPIDYAVSQDHLFIDNSSERMALGIPLAISETIVPAVAVVVFICPFGAVENA